MDRRQVLAAAGSLLAPATAGCTSLEPDGEGGAGDPPKPVVEDVRIPAVEHVDRDGMPPVESIDSGSDAETDADADADTDPEFTATFENVGDAGEAAISLSLLEADDPDGDVLTAGAPARTTFVDFAAGERREVAFDDVSAEGADAYYLEARIGSIQADVRNDGAAGLVEVALTAPDGERVDKRRTLELGADETATVSFDGAFMRDAYDVRAEPATE